jgi:hypothetical protein
MYVVNNSSRALFVALIPLAVVHAVLTAMALLGAQAAQPTDVPSPGRVLVLYVTRLATDGALLYRRFAGLEPVPLPEAVIATDPNALVGADDPARHQHRVILSN